MEGTYLTVAEVADLLRLSRHAAYKMIERGQLAGVVRIGTRLRIERETLVHSLHQNRTPSLIGGQ
jgi:excisionase family DNA binding protein